MNFRKILFILLTAFAPIFLSSCADVWFDWRNKDNPPPITPAVPVDPVSENTSAQAASSVPMDDNRLISVATQSLIMALSREGLTGISLLSPQNSIYADRVYSALLDENIVKMGSDYVLIVSAPTPEGIEITISKEIGGTPVFRLKVPRTAPAN